MRMISASVQNTPLGFQRFDKNPPCVRESHPLLNAGSRSPPSVDTASLCVGVLAVGMRTSVTHGIAGSTGISPASLWCCEERRQTRTR